MVIINCLSVYLFNSCNLILNFFFKKIAVLTFDGQNRTDVYFIYNVYFTSTIFFSEVKLLPFASAVILYK